MNTIEILQEKKRDIQNQLQDKDLPLKDRTLYEEIVLPLIDRQINDLVNDGYESDKTKSLIQMAVELVEENY